MVTACEKGDPVAPASVASTHTPALAPLAAPAALLTTPVVLPIVKLAP
jgi:hypothetical protein